MGHAGLPLPISRQQLEEGNAPTISRAVGQVQVSRRRVALTVWRAKRSTFSAQLHFDPVAGAAGTELTQAESAASELAENVEE